MKILGGWPARHRQFYEMEQVFASAGITLELCDTVNKDDERFIISINGKRIQLSACSNRVDGAWLIVKELQTS